MADDENAASRRSVLRAGALATVAGTSTGRVGATSGETVTVPDDYESVQAAVDAVQSGGTVRVREGRYTESVRVGKPVTVLGDPGARDEPGPGPEAPVFDGEGRRRTGAFRLHADGVSPDDVTVRGVEIRGYGERPTGDAFGFGVGAGAGNDRVTVADCRIADVGASGVSVAGPGEHAYRDWTVERCVVEDCGESCVRFDHVSGSAIRDNVFRCTRVVPDGEANEKGRTDRQSDKAVELHANTADGNSSVQEGVEISGNRIEGTFDVAGVYLLAINKNASGGGTAAVLRDVTVADNDIAVGSDSVPRFQSGIGVAVFGNSVDDAETRVRNVTVRGNSITGASAGVQVAGSAAGAVAGVQVADTSVTDSAVGVGLFPETPDGVTSLVVDGCDLGSNFYGAAVGGASEALTLRRCNVVGNSEFGVANFTDGGVVDARRNYWGAPDGPTRPVPGNGREGSDGPSGSGSANGMKEGWDDGQPRGFRPDLPGGPDTLGSGDAVTAGVDVRPWLPRSP